MQATVFKILEYACDPLINVLHMTSQDITWLHSSFPSQYQVVHKNCPASWFPSKNWTAKIHFFSAKKVIISSGNTQDMLRAYNFHKMAP